MGRLLKAEVLEVAHLEGRVSLESKNAKRLVTIVILAFALSDVLVFLYLRDRSSQTSQDAQLAGEEILVGSRVAGQLSLLGKEEGAAVSKADMLITLDQSGLAARLREAAADRDLAEKSQQLAAQRLSQAKAELAVASAQLQGGVISRQRYEELDMAASSAEVQLNLAQSLLDLARQRLESARSEESSSLVLSPVSGRVARLWKAKGEWVFPGEPVYSIYENGSLWINARFAKAGLGRIAVGDRASVWLEDQPKIRLEGRVVALGTESERRGALDDTEAQAGSFVRIEHRGMVMITLDPPAKNGGFDTGTLVPGMKARVTVWTGR